MPSDWKSFGCPQSSRRWRYLDDGKVEVEGLGTPTPRASWPQAVSDRAESIGRWAAHYSVPEQFVAAIMALESGGQNICRTPSGGNCTGADCNCVGGEGCGVMATLPATYKQALELDHQVTCHEIMADEDSAVRAGVATLKTALDRYDGDFVKAAVAYNAGSVRCGVGRTWGGDHPKQDCPDPNGWGVVTGCMYSASGGSLCAKSSIEGTPAYVCTNEYPMTAIRWLNSAVDNYKAGSVSPPLSKPGSLGSAAKLLSFLGGIVLGQVGWKALEEWRKRTK